MLSLSLGLARESLTTRANYGQQPNGLSTVHVLIRSSCSCRVIVVAGVGVVAVAAIQCLNSLLELRHEGSQLLHIDV